MKTHPTQEFYSQRNKAYLNKKAKFAKAKNLLLTVVISLIACSPLVASVYLLTNK